MFILFFNKFITNFEALVFSMNMLTQKNKYKIKKLN